MSANPRHPNTAPRVSLVVVAVVAIAVAMCGVDAMRSNAMIFPTHHIPPRARARRAARAPPCSVDRRRRPARATSGRTR
jgi:hypothetical protein